MNRLTQYCALLIMVISLPLLAENKSVFDRELLDLQHAWAKTNYAQPGDKQKEEFKLLVKTAEQFSATYSERAEAWIWYGIIQSSYAGAKGGLGALSLAKDAKKSLEKALQLDKQALAGSAYTSLGTLYHKVPGWPIGFGDDDKAQQLLQEALKINPKGIDPNYFYGAYLYDQGAYEQAKATLLQAKNAAARSDRPLADKARQQEVAQLLLQVEKKLN